MFRPLAVIFSLVSIAPVFSATQLTQLDTAHRVVISIRDQKLMLLENGGGVAIYPDSTSKYGDGDFRGRKTTPHGYHTVTKQIGENTPGGPILNKRRRTRE